MSDNHELITRLGVLRDWVHANRIDLYSGIDQANPFVMRFIHAFADALVLGTADAVEAAEIVLVELDADWEGK